MTTTIAYMTNRRDCRIQWFFDSLHRETNGDYTDIRVVVVDFFAQAHLAWTEQDVSDRKQQFSNHAKCPIIHVPPKPTVWQGPYRLTKTDFFAAANARNTAICLAPDGWLVFVDDISVLAPGWLAAVRHAQRHNYIALGTFRKVYDLHVENGEVISFKDNPIGHDTRLDRVIGDDPVPAHGGWCFGASLAIPVETLLALNGFDEDCDSMSGEDYILGIMLERAGHTLKLCPRMFTYESEELHFAEKPFLRIIKKHAGYPDASHAILDWVYRERRSAPNYQSMRDTRALVLSGQPFPVIGCPEHDWRDKQPLREMGEECLEAAR